MRIIRLGSPVLLLASVRRLEVVGRGRLRRNTLIENATAHVLTHVACHLPWRDDFVFVHHVVRDAAAHNEVSLYALSIMTTTAAKSLFKDVHFYLSHSLPPEQCDHLRQMLTLNDAHDAKHDSSALTHFITNSLPNTDSLEYTAERDGLHFVTPAWVERTVVLGMRQEPNGYSPHAAMLFSGVVATTSDLSATDNEIIAAGIGSLGGQWRTALTKDVTHVFALASGSAKYETAMHFREATKMKVLVPHWFDDVVRLGCRSLPTEQYEWPDPKVFRAYGVEAAKATGAAAASAADDRESRRSKPPSTEKKILYDTALSTSSDLPPQRPASADLWHGLKIMFGSTLNFKASQLEAHIADVERAGGEVVLYDSAEEELEKIEQADVYIARHRIGRVFVKVCRAFYCAVTRF